MRKILVICDFFPPTFAPRMGYLCKYLPEYGWEPVVITEYIPQHIYKELSENCQNITYVNYYHSSNNFVQILKYAFVFLADFFCNYKDLLITKIAQKQVEQHNIELILTSSYRTFPIQAAHKLSKINKIPLIVDLRDIIEQFPGNEHISKRITNIKFLNRYIAKVLTKMLFEQRNRVLENANVVTTVSPWHVETLKQFAKNVQLIYNGYDPDLFFHKKIANSKFSITYTGRLMSKELRDPSLLFEAVSNLYITNKIKPDNFRVQFYTDNKSIHTIHSMAERYGISSFVDISGYVSNQMIPDILNESAMLLLLTNKSVGPKTPKGIMTTKFFEYLAVEKPILCVRNDEGCLEKTIRETRSGIAAHHVEQVEHFILEKYDEWKQTGYTHQNVDMQKVQQFSRKEQAKHFIRIFESLIET